MSEIRVSEALAAELDRVGVSYRKAGAADYVLAVSVGGVWLLGPPRLHPRPTWQGSEDVALALLATVADATGPEAFWTVFIGPVRNGD